MNNDVTEEYITTEFGNEFKNYFIGTKSGKIHKVPGDTKKESHLHEWRLFHYPNASVIQ